MLENKEQIIILGGGMTFESKEKMHTYYREHFDIDYPQGGKSWKDWLIWSLEEKYNFLKPHFPLNDNSDYEVRKIIFEKYLNKIQGDEVILIAHSLGTIFILKYLLENTFKFKIKELHLVSPIISNTFQKENDVEQTGSYTFDIELVKNLKIPKVHIWHSADDEVCSIANSEYLVENIENAIFHKFENRGHFNQSTFPELYDEFRK